MKPLKNQIWKDNDSSITRYVQVTGPVDRYGRVEITTIQRSDEKYSLPHVIENGMITYPRADRFNNKSDGYTLVASSLKEFNQKDVSLHQYVKRLARKHAAERAAATVDAGSVTIFAMPKSTPQAGEIWREMKGTCARYVQVVREAVDGKVQIVTRYFTDVAGERPKIAKDLRPTNALESRFNGKPGGYEYVCRNLTRLLEGEELKKRFVPAGSTLESVMASILPNIKKDQLWHEVGEKTCYHLVTIVGVTDEMVEVSTNYIGQQGEEKPPTHLVRGKSKIVPIDDFATFSNRYALVHAA